MILAKSTKTKNSFVSVVSFVELLLLFLSLAAVQSTRRTLTSTFLAYRIPLVSVRVLIRKIDSSRRSAKRSVTSVSTIDLR